MKNKNNLSNILVDIIAPLFFGICGLVGDLYVLFMNPNFNDSATIITLIVGSAMFVFGMISALIGVMKMNTK